MEKTAQCCRRTVPAAVLLLIALVCCYPAATRARRTPQPQELLQHSQLLLQHSQQLLQHLLQADVAKGCGSQASYGSDYLAAARANLTSFKSNLLSKVYESFDEKANYSKGFDRYDPYNPIIQCPPGQPATDYGAGDGRKRLCDMSKLQAPCTVFSLGSNGDYSFKKDALKSTPCQVHTFDCTYNGTSQDPARHTYHKICVGSQPDSDFKSWKRITTELQLLKVDVAKIDIEGHEGALVSEFHHGDVLPDQLVMEIHMEVYPQAAKRPGEVALLFHHLADLGYAITNRENNLWGSPGCCAEFAWLLIDCDRPASRLGLSSHVGHRQHVRPR